MSLTPRNAAPGGLLRASTLAVLLLAALEVRAQGAVPARDSIPVASAAAEGEGDGEGFRRPDRVQFMTSAAFGSPQQGWLGRTPGRDVFLGVVRVSWRVSGSERAAFGYFGEFIPMAVVTSNPTAIRPLKECLVDHPEWTDRGSVPVIEYFEACAERSASAYGVGVTPFGISGRFARSNGAALVTDLSVGVIMFDKKMPYPPATRLNYNITLGTAIEFPVAGRSFVSVGYNLKHLSNGGRGDFNPGVAAHAIQLGWGRRSR